MYQQGLGSTVIDTPQSPVTTQLWKAVQSSMSKAACRAILPKLLLYGVCHTLFAAPALRPPRTSLSGRGRRTPASCGQHYAIQLRQSLLRHPHGSSDSRVYVLNGLDMLPFKTRPHGGVKAGEFYRLPLLSGYQTLQLQTSGRYVCGRVAL